MNVEDWLNILDQESVIAQESPKEIFSRSGTVTSRSSRKSNISEVMKICTSNRNPMEKTDLLIKSM